MSYFESELEYYLGGMKGGKPNFSKLSLSDIESINDKQCHVDVWVREEILNF